MTSPTLSVLDRHRTYWWGVVDSSHGGGTSVIEVLLHLGRRVWLHLKVLIQPDEGESAYRKRRENGRLGEAHLLEEIECFRGIGVRCLVGMNNCTL
jgi:hypothetical protein